MPQVRKYGYIPDYNSARDFKFSVVAPVTLPKTVNRIGLNVPIKNQGQLGYCVSNGIARAVEKILAVDARSRFMIQYNGQVLEKSIGQDNGIMIRSGISGLQKNGACIERLDPYRKVLAKAPSQAAVKDGITILPQIGQYQRVSTLRQVKTALSKGCPVVMGFSVVEYFESAEIEKTGFLPYLPKQKYIGGHCTVFEGYVDNPKASDAEAPYLWVANSWGPNWGPFGGYFKMDQRWVTDSNNLVSDMWVILKK